jgi:succinyl-CoA synthetase beta subunit
MARKRITEHTAKKILYPKLRIAFSGAAVTSLSPDSAFSELPDKTYVVKVDQGVKKRMKKGLVKINVPKEELKTAVADISEKGYSQFLIEEMVDHSQDEEKYLSLERTREGIVVFYSLKGGIDVEDNTHHIQRATIEDVSSNRTKIEQISSYLSVPADFLENILSVFEENFFSFLEINPLVVKKGKPYILDLAVEVDSTAEFFVNRAWSSQDFIDVFSLHKTDEEKTVAKLAKESQAAFSLEVLNKDGAIFVLLSGGGASLVLADELYNLGFGKELGNYGEFSGNPNAEETYLYTKAILSLLLNSKAPKKVLIVGGGVANFTDIRITFKGVVKALQEFSSELKKQNITIFVRRGGPHQKEGLEMMEDFLKNSDIKGEVYGPDIVLTEVVKKGITLL